jgi:chromosome segregation ATPase
MQSIQIAYEKSKATAHKLGVENDTLKQQLKFLRERLAEMGDLKIEKDTLEVALQETRSNFEATLDQLKLSKATEQATENNLKNVNRRLEEANVQRVDVLEENSELHGMVSSLQRGMEQMKKEVEELRMRPEASVVDTLNVKLIKAEEEKKLLSQQAEAAEGRTDLPAVVAELSFKLEDAKRSVTEKNKYIGELESQTNDLSKEMEQLREERAKLTESNAVLRATQSQKSNQKRYSYLEKQIVEIEKSRHAAQAESEKHLQLLKEQLRRTATDIHKREHPASNLLEKKLNIEEAIAEVRLKAERRLAKEQNANDDEEADTENPETRVEHLEKEVEYHVRDIVLYKLDVKGYRKDLKRAKDKINALTEAAAVAEAAAAAALAAQQESRPSVSSQSSNASLPQLSPSITNAISDSERDEPATPSIATALQVQMPMRHIVSAWSPSVSPRTTPLAEKKAFTTA